MKHFFIAVSALLLMSCGGAGTGTGKGEDTVDVKAEVEQTAQSVEDSAGKVDVQKLEQMMEDAK